MDGNLPAGEDLPADGGAHVDVEGNGEASAAHDDCSGNTVIITPSSGDCSSAPESITEIVKVSGSFYCTPDQLDSSRGTRCFYCCFFCSPLVCLG